MGQDKVNKAYICFKKVKELDPKHRGANRRINELENDQEMLNNYGVISKKDTENPEVLLSNYHIGQAHKGFNMIDKAFKHFKKEKEKK